MVNPFDRFDTVDTPQGPQSAEANPFDQFDSKTAGPSVSTTGGFKAWQVEAAKAELKKRGVVGPPVTERQQGFRQLAGDTNALEAFLISMGQGFESAGQGFGITEQRPKESTEKEAMQALETMHPIATGAGKFIGNTLPFIPAMLSAPQEGLPAIASNIGLATLEGGVLAKGQGEDVTKGAATGAILGLGAETVFPVMGKLAHAVFKKLGRNVKGPLLTRAGQPTPELSQALEDAGLSFDDLTEGAVDFISKAKVGASPEQAARGARFMQKDVPFSQGELTQNTVEKSLERRLRGERSGATDLVQLKEDQSIAIEERLRSIFKDLPESDETGEAFKRVLEGKNKALYTEKKDLYAAAEQEAKDLGEVPIMTDSLFDAVSSENVLNRARIKEGKGIKELEDTLAYYQVTMPPTRVLKNLDASGEYPSELLTVENFDELRKTLNSIMTDTPRIAHLVKPIREALDQEASIVEEALVRSQGSSTAITKFRRAREAVVQRDTDFSPKSLAGKIISDDKGDSLIQASQVYNKIMQGSASPEAVRKLLKVTLEADGGKKAVEKLQATTLLDLINAGFSKESLDGIPVFNPAAFIKRYETIKPNKLKEIFRNNPKALKEVESFITMAKDLKPGRQQDLRRSTVAMVAERVALFKLPILGAALAGAAKVLGRGALVRGATKKAVNPKLISTLDKSISHLFPGVAAALGTAAAQGENNE